jgi:hypothetical protein
MEDDIDPRETALFDAHYNEIARRFGKARAERANIGWGHGEGSLCSKIYGKRLAFLTTDYDPETFEIFGHSTR